MTDTIEYSLMAGAAYFSTRDSKNRIPRPDGWEQIDKAPWHTQENTTGFEAVAFTRGTDIVISFAGTYPKPKSISNPDLIADVTLGAGVYSAQIGQAAVYYEKIRQAYPDANITFTGHSLGGGLAALMGVFFNKTAVTFDPAPFRQSATIFNIRQDVGSYKSADNQITLRQNQGWTLMIAANNAQWRAAA